MQVVVLNGSLTEAEQDEYIKQVTARCPIGLIEKLFLDVQGEYGMSITPATGFVNCGRWAAAVLAHLKIGTMPSKPSCGTQFQTVLTYKSITASFLAHGHPLYGPEPFSFRGFSAAAFCP